MDRWGQEEIIYDKDENIVTVDGERPKIIVPLQSNRIYINRACMRAYDLESCTHLEIRLEQESRRVFFKPVSPINPWSRVKNRPKICNPFFSSFFCAQELKEDFLIGLNRATRKADYKKCKVLARPCMEESLDASFFVYLRRVEADQGLK